MNIKFTKTPEAYTPFKASDYSAGFDLITTTTHALLPGEVYTYHTGLKVAIPKNYAGFIFARSGLGCKNGVTPRNCVGVIDSDYRGEILVVLVNNGVDIINIEHGQRIAQLVIIPTPDVEFEEVDELDTTTRDNNGFGSTGI